jgi:hypothetical protein
VSDDVEPFYAGVQVFDEAHLSGCMASLAITGDSHKIERNFDANLPDQVGKENGRTLEDADQVYTLALEILGNLNAHLSNAFLDRAASQQDFQMLLSMAVHCEPPPPESGYSSAGTWKAQAKAKFIALTGVRMGIESHAILVATLNTHL